MSDLLRKTQLEIIEKRNIHLAFISAFFNGNSCSYLNYFHNKLVEAKKAKCAYEIMELTCCINFVTAYIPPKIKWNAIDCDN